MEKWAAVCIECEYVKEADYPEQAQEYRRQHTYDTCHMTRLATVQMDGTGQHGKITDWRMGA